MFWRFFSVYIPHITEIAMVCANSVSVNAESQVVVGTIHFLWNCLSGDNGT